ncbi:MAG: zinc-finger domain-containing protein [Alphaproteobacteria bacterium]|nr:zinc-finger domain-containing protein [Alphaproteobacteria bacterium]
MTNRKPQIISVPHTVIGVKCNGGNSSLGHPAVYYQFPQNGEVACQYCGQHFRQDL